MEENWSVIVVAVIGVIPGLIGAVAGIGALFIQRRQAKADAAGTLTDATVSLVGPMNQRIDNLVAENAGLKNRVESLEHEVTELKQDGEAKNALIAKYEAGIKLLMHQVVSLGHAPVFNLPEK